jgi:hypothetical protein
MLLDLVSWHRPMIVVVTETRILGWGGGGGGGLKLILRNLPFDGA